jgi:hypothetical protein
METNRINCVSRIKNKWMRRTAIIFTFPFIFMLNCLDIIWYCVCVVLQTPFWCIENNAELFKSAKLRWNTAKDG